MSCVAWFFKDNNYKLKQNKPGKAGQKGPNKIRNERGATTDTTEIQRIVRNNCNRRQPIKLTTYKK